MFRSWWNSSGLDLHVELFDEHDGKTSYEIYSGGDEGRAIHCRGRAAVEPIGDVADMPADTRAHANQDAALGEVGTSLVNFTPVWEPVVREASVSWPSPRDRVVIVGGTPARQAKLRQYYPDAQQLEIPFDTTPEVIFDQLQAMEVIDHIVWMAPEALSAVVVDEAVIEGQRQGVLRCFRLIKAASSLGYGSKSLGWTIITAQSQAIRRHEAIDPTHASVHGLIGSMAREYPNWQVRLVDLPLSDEWPFDELLQLPSDARGKSWGYRDGGWYRHIMLPSELLDVKGVLYRSGGVYVVIGGAGGIGEAWSEYMIRVYQAQIVWIGRRPQDAAIQRKLDRLATRGLAPCYIEADATDRRALERAYEKVKQDYGQVHGVIHSAIVLRDKSLAKMEEVSFTAALSAKVDVSVRLAQVFGAERLDFVLFFSSLVSFDSPAGQSNYAAGCTFKDAFAYALGRTWSCPVKVMNWGYWGNIGIVASADHRTRMELAGLGSIEAEEGMAALERLLAGPQNQLGFAKTTGALETERLAALKFSGDSIGVSELLRVYASDVPPIVAKLPSAGGNLRERSLGSREVDELIGKLLWTQLIAAGFPEGEMANIAAIKARLGLHDSYDRWLEESLDILTARGYLKRNSEDYSAVERLVLATEASWREWDLSKNAWLTDTAIAPQINLVEATLRALPGVLSGEVRATDVLFPSGSLALVEGIYRNNPVADYFNEALAGMVASFVEERLKQDSSACIRILEVGAGTGGTSAEVFARLKPYRDSIEEYRYTDLSQAFLQHAREVYGPDIPYLCCSILDVEKPVAAQGIDAGSYDLVIAANVLHATRNIRRTLRNVKGALRTNGLLLLNEISGKSLLTHLTFGLLEGWWLYEDANLRIPGCPGLSSEGWRRVLEQEGFRSILYPVPEAHALGQQIVAAESDGVVRLMCVEAKASRTAIGPSASPRAAEGFQ